MGSLFGGGESKSAGTQYQTQNQNQSTRYSPEYEQYVNNVLGRATEAGDKPYQGYDISKMFAGFTGDQNQAFDQIRGFQGAYQPYFDSAKGQIDKVQGYDSRGAAQPYLDRAGNSITPYQAGAQGTLSSMRSWADPATNAAYMNPYAEGAVNRAADISNRNFMEKTMPGITSQFAKGTGALGRGPYSRFAGQAVRDLAGEQAGTAATMMDKAWWNAANQFNTDQSRMQTGAGQLGALARSDIDAAGQLAKLNADITSGAVQNGINVANAYSTQAGALSNLNLMNTQALLQAGNQQQQQNQLPLTAGYQQWQQQQNFDWDTIAKMNAAQRGLSIPTTQSGTTSTQGGSGSTSQAGQPSVAGSVLGTLASANTLFGKGNQGGIERGMDWLTGGSSNSTPPPQTIDQEISNWSGYGGATGAARGGLIRPRYARGGAVSRYGHGGPVFASPQDYGGLRRYAVGGNVPVMRGMQSRNQPPMPPPGMMGPPPGALPPGPFSRQGGLSFPMPPMGGPPPGPPGPPPGPPGPPPGALGMMR